MKNNIIFYIAAIALFTSCSKITNFTDSINNTSAREIYVRENKSITGIPDWKASFQASQNDSLSVALPYLEKGVFRPAQIIAYSYSIPMNEGEILEIAIIKDSLHQQVFIDLFEIGANRMQPIAVSKSGQSSLEHAIEATGNYKVIIQPELSANTNFQISISKKPQYGFPVAGKGNAAIQSFWGYERDNGTRKHEGVDIFAKRGTPVVAVSDGIIANTGDKGLGGKQVWQRTDNFRTALYYAHLDSIIAKAGARVKKGDTLGLVGSTGNAKGGAPHLHFGIYKNGAVDPLPFIYTIAKPEIPRSVGKLSFDSAVLAIKSGEANLRQAPSTSAAIIGKIEADSKVTWLGEHKEWLHIRTSSGQKAFVHKSLVKTFRG